jgi:RNA polymerase sigma factor (sigma-70 family)
MCTLASSIQNHAPKFSDLAAWSDEQLIAAAKNGKKDSFGELCQRHSQRILRVTQRIVRNREDAEDALQGSFLKAFVHLQDFDQRSQFSTWLTRIAINSALAKLRKKRGIREVDIDGTDPALEFPRQREIKDRAPNPEDTFLLGERKQILTAAVSALRPRARDVVLSQLREHSVRETAQMLSISTAAVKTRIFHARAALKRMPSLRAVAKLRRQSHAA